MSKLKNVESDILFYAFRYALGRRTFSVNDVTDCIKNNIEFLPDNDIHNMHKEILRELSISSSSDSYYNDLWIEVLGLLTFQIESRKLED